MFKTFTSNVTVIILTDNKVKRKWKIFHKETGKYYLEWNPSAEINDSTV